MPQIISESQVDLVEPGHTINEYNNPLNKEWVVAAPDLTTTIMGLLEAPQDYNLNPTLRQYIETQLSTNIITTGVFAEHPKSAAIFMTGVLNGLRAPDASTQNVLVRADVRQGGQIVLLSASAESPNTDLGTIEDTPITMVDIQIAQPAKGNPGNIAITVLTMGDQPSIDKTSSNNTTEAQLAPRAIGMIEIPLPATPDSTTIANVAFLHLMEQTLGQTQGETTYPTHVAIINNKDPLPQLHTQIYAKLAFSNALHIQPRSKSTDSPPTNAITAETPSGAIKQEPPSEASPLTFEQQSKRMYQTIEDISNQHSQVLECLRTTALETYKNDPQNRARTIIEQAPLAEIVTKWMLNLPFTEAIPARAPINQNNIGYVQDTLTAIVTQQGITEIPDKLMDNPNDNLIRDTYSTAVMEDIPDDELRILRALAFTKQLVIH